MFELIKYEPSHAIEILRNGAKEPGMAATEQHERWAQQMFDNGPAVTGLFDGKVVACGGIWILGKGRGEQWALYAEDIGSYHIDPTLARDWMMEQIKTNKLWRLQTPLKSDYPEGVVYAKWMGFEFEATLKGYRDDGADAIMYTIINKQYVPVENRMRIE